jgi:hypothetical protein
MNLYPFSSRAHTESEFDMLGVHRKLVKYVLHLFKRKKLNLFIYFLHKLPKQQSTSFWSQGILGIKGPIVPTRDKPVLGSVA